ncbi:MAG: hypothetical protein ACIAXF_17315 [Phycisphaerales bacterium JB063]
MKTYQTTRPLAIQCHAFDKGVVLGTGDIDKGEFEPADGLEGPSGVNISHIIPRVADGRVEAISSQTDPPAEKPDGSGRGRKAKKTSTTKGN